MALTDLTRISTSGIATGTSLSGAILHGDAHFRGTNAGINSAIFDSSENELNLKDNVKLTFGNSGASDSQFYFDSNNLILQETSATGSMTIRGQQLRLQNPSQSNENYIECLGDSANRRVKLYQGTTTRFETTQHGAIVTGILTATSFSGPTYNTSGITTFYDLRVSNNLIVEGTTTTLDTNVTSVDRLEINADSNTNSAIIGIQSGTADLVQLYDGATQVVTVDDTGLVSIGKTTNAGKAIEVYQTGDAAIRIQNNASGTGNNDGILLEIGNTTKDALIYNYEAANMRFGTAGTEAVRITGSRSVGIGTTNPKTKFNVYTFPHSDTGGILVQNANYTANLDKPYLIAGTQTWTGAATDWSTYGFQHKLKSDSLGTPRLTIDGSSGGSNLIEIITFMKSGRVGIGTESPDAPLHILSDANNMLQIESIDRHSTIYIIDNLGSSFIQNDSGELRFGVGGMGTGAGGENEALRIDSDGLVGVGTHNPSNPLHILGEDPQIKIQDLGGTNAQIFLDGNASNFSFDWVSSAQRNINLINSGSGTVRVGIGHTAPDTLLHLQGDKPKLRIESTNALEASAGTEEIGRIEFEATKGANLNVAASMRIRQDGTWSTVDDWFSPTAIEFYTQDQSGTEITTPRLTINRDGEVGIGTNDPATILDIVGDAPVLSVEATNDSSGFRVDVKGQSTGELFRIQKDGTTKLQIDQSDLITFFSTLTFNGTELYPLSGIGSNVGHRLNYRRNAPQSRTNTGNASQQYYKIGEIVLNGSESAEINIYGTQSYSAGSEIAGKVTIIMRATNGNTLAGFWYEETLGNVNLSDVRWKYSSGTTYELWVKASAYANIAPFIRCTGNGFTSFNDATGDGTAPAGSTAFSTYHRKNVGTINTIRYNSTDTTFHQNIKMDSGKGIDFSSTSDVGTLGSELFNDYESGTYTPTFTTGSGGSVSSTTSGTLSYVKVGRLMHVQGRIHVTLSASDVTEFEISLPVANTSGDAYDTSSVQVVIRAAGGEPAGGIRNFRISGNSSQMRMQNEDGMAYGNFGVTNPHINVNVQYYCQ